MQRLSGSSVWVPGGLPKVQRIRCMQQAGAGGAAETVQERQRSGSCQVGGTAALRTDETALVDGGIVGAAAEVVQGDIEEVR